MVTSSRRADGRRGAQRASWGGLAAMAACGRALAGCGGLWPRRDQQGLSEPIRHPLPLLPLNSAGGGRLARCALFTGTRLPSNAGEEQTRRLDAAVVVFAGDLWPASSRRDTTARWIRCAATAADDRDRDVVFRGLLSPFPVVFLLCAKPLGGPKGEPPQDLTRQSDCRQSGTQSTRWIQKEENQFKDGQRQGVVCGFKVRDVKLPQSKQARDIT